MSSTDCPALLWWGFLSEAVRAQERVRTALKNAGIHLPPKKVMVNLSPGDIREGRDGL